MAGYSHKTQKAYLGHVTRFHSYIGKDLEKLSIDVIKIPRPKKENKLPKVIGENTVIKILKALENEKHKTILFIVYSAGLRVGEVVRLRVENIDIQYYQR